MRPLALDNIGVSFGGIRALQNVTLTVTKGERVAIVGPNGAGKSTLLHVIGGQVQPSSGSVHLFENNVTALSPDGRAELGLSRTFQTTNLLGELTVYTNVALAANACLARFPSLSGAAYWPTQSVQTARALLDEWNLDPQSGSPVADRSYGEQRSVETIMALARNPRLLLFDEPSAGMSKTETEKMINAIDNIDPDITVLIIEHDLDVVRRVASRVVVLQGGQIVADASPEKISEDPVMREIYWFTDEHQAVV